ncbi:MAG: hypothetical protein C0474_11930 [Sphingobium sp.]|nr:hypothetical protein [Sphingobium sp.]
MEARASVLEGKRLVHYTSAEAAYKIISSRQIWLRNAQMMNDFSEIQHGISCLQGSWASEAGLALQAMLNRIKEGLRDELAELFDGHAEELRRASYIVSLSEHDDDEDEYGRLSMWRAYGGRSGVAMVLNNTAFVSETDQMRVFSSPVIYKDMRQFTEWFQRWASAVVTCEEKLKALGPEAMRNILFWVFRSFALCTKHPGFAEEREWRVFYSPVFEGDSEWIEPAVEIVGGVPQHLMKLHLIDNPEKHITGVAPKTMLNRIIIGPCEYPVQVRAAIGEAMAKAEIENPLDIMWMSLIPLRNS